MKKRFTCKGLSLVLALAMILSLMPMTFAWAESDNAAGVQVAEDTSDTVSPSYKFPKIVKSKYVKPVYVTVDMGYDHQELAAKVFADWEEILKNNAPDMDRGGMDLEDGRMTLAVPAKAFHVAGFENFLNGVIVKSASGKSLKTLSVTDGDDKFLGVASEIIANYDSIADVAAEYVKNIRKDLNDRDDFYVLWEKPITQISIGAYPLECGTKVTTVVKDFKVYQLNAPEVVTGDDDASYEIDTRIGLEKYGIEMPFWTEKMTEAGTDASAVSQSVSADEAKALLKDLTAKVKEIVEINTKGTSYSFTAKGGETYYVNLLLDSKFGYSFERGDLNISLNGDENLEAGTFSATVLTLPGHPVYLQIPVKADHVWGDDEIIKEPTINANGEAKSTCTVCGETTTYEVSNEEVVAEYKALKAANTPAKVRLARVKGGNNKAKATWTTLKNVSGYQVQFINAKTGKSKTVKAGASTKKAKSKTVKLGNKKIYITRVRAYKKAGGYTFYGAWSNTRNVKTK